MSLLLKALENAARNREAAGPAADADASRAAPEPREPAEEITLEPLPQSARAQSGARSHATQSRGSAQAAAAAVEEERSPSQHQAQSVLRAGAPVSRPNIFDWFAQRPLVAFSTVAGLFAIGYGTYLYLQLTNPGIFASRPPPVVKPPVMAVNPPPPQAPAPSASAIAPVPPGPHPAAGPVTSSPPAPGSAAPSSVLPGPAFTPGPAPAAPPSAAVPTPPAPPAVAATPPASPATGLPPRAPTAIAPVPALPGQEPALAGKASVPPQPSPASPKVAIEVLPDAPAAPRARVGKPVLGRTAAVQPPPDGITPSTASPVVVPVSATLSSAHQALERGQLDEAERLYRQSLSSDPRSIDAMLGLAAALATQRKSEAASQYYMRVLEQDPRNAYAQAGLLNLSGGADPVAAETRLKQLIAREPSGFLYFSLGNLYAEHGQWAPAQAAYFQAHMLSPDNPDYAFNLAVGLEHLSQPKIALNYYRRALALAQSRGHAQFDAAGVQSRIHSLETVLAEKP